MRSLNLERDGNSPRRLWVILLFTAFFSNFAQASQSGLFHEFYVGSQCPSQKILMDEAPQANNYSEFLGHLLGSLQKGGDECSMAMILNLQSFIRTLISQNNHEQFQIFFHDLNKAYQIEIKGEQSQNQICRLHNNLSDQVVDSCASDHLVDVAVLANRAWAEYFADHLSALHSRNRMIRVTEISAGGIGVVGLVFRSQIKRAGIKVIKRLGRRMSKIFSKRGASLLRGGTIGSGGGLAHNLKTQETETSLALKIEEFKAPIEFLQFPDHSLYEDSFGYDEGLVSEGVDLGATLGAGILPAMLAESQVYRLAYLIPTLSGGFGARAAAASRKFIKSPLGKIAAAVVATITAGKFLLDEWNVHSLKKRIADVYGQMEALKMEIKNSNPNSLSTYLMTQELVNLTQTLALFYAVPVLGKMEEQYQVYTSQAVCVPLQAVSLNEDPKVWEDLYFRRFQNQWKRQSTEVFQHHPQSWFETLRRQLQRDSDPSNSLLQSTDLYDGDDPMELAIKTLVETLQFINHHIAKQEYNGLKMRLYDVTDYLLRFKNAGEYQARLERSIHHNVEVATVHAKALQEFFVSYQQASPPEYRQISVATWNRYLKARSFFEGSQQAAQAQGYSYQCEHSMFQDYFIDLSLYRAIVPCAAEGAELFANCVERE